MIRTGEGKKKCPPCQRGSQRKPWTADLRFYKSPQQQSLQLCSLLQIPVGMLPSGLSTFQDEIPTWSFGEHLPMGKPSHKAHAPPVLRMPCTPCAKDACPLFTCHSPGSRRSSRTVPRNKFMTLCGVSWLPPAIPPHCSPYASRSAPPQAPPGLVATSEARAVPHLSSGNPSQLPVGWQVTSCTSSQQQQQPSELCSFPHVSFPWLTLGFVLSLSSHSPVKRLVALTSPANAGASSS